MRPVLAPDLICAARAVMAAPRNAQVSMAQALLFQAETADWHRRRFGEAHPLFGDGTLAAAARHAPMEDERALCDGEMAAAMITVLRTVLQRASVHRSPV